MSIGSRRKESEISSICLFLVTHLNHELTRAAYELRVWVRARAQLKTLSSLLNMLHSCMLRVFDVILSSIQLSGAYQNASNSGW